MTGAAESCPSTRPASTATKTAIVAASATPSSRAEPSESQTAAITANPREILAIATGGIRHAIARRTTGPTGRRFAAIRSAVMRIVSLRAGHDVSPAYSGIYWLSWISTPGHAAVKSRM